MNDELTCANCGIPLGPGYEDGDVCADCFEKFDGMTIEEIVGNECREESDAD